jgi:hypothetical protein
VWRDGELAMIRSLRTASSAARCDPVRERGEESGAVTDRDDPRWLAVAEDDPVSATRWYGALDSRRRALVGLRRAQFDSQQTLEYKTTAQAVLVALLRRLPFSSPETSYLGSVVAEEAQHVQLHQCVAQQLAAPSGRAGSLTGGLPRALPAEAARDDVSVLSAVRAWKGAAIARIDQYLAHEAERQHPLLADAYEIQRRDELRHIAYLDTAIAVRGRSACRRLPPVPVADACRRRAAMPLELLHDLGAEASLAATRDYRAAARRCASALVKRHEQGWSHE